MTRPPFDRRFFASALGDQTMMLLETFPVGSFQCNCSVLACADTKEALVVDPGGEHQRILEIVRHYDLTVKWILHTHAHLDHIYETRDVKEQAGGTIALHRADAFLYDGFAMQAAMFGWQVRPTLPVEHWLTDGESLAFGKRAAEVIHTPGHTPGSCCFRVDSPRRRAAARRRHAVPALDRPHRSAGRRLRDHRAIDQAEDLHARSRHPRHPRPRAAHHRRRRGAPQSVRPRSRMIPYPDRIRRARLPTPVEPTRRLSQQLGVELLVKRDDLTGSSLSGNKIRKLEFLFAEAAAQGADTVITCGGEQSNHCRATAIAAAELGLRSYLLLRTDDPQHAARRRGQHPARSARRRRDPLGQPRGVRAARAAVRRGAASSCWRSGAAAYVIPEGGSNALGAWGYVGCVEELAARARRPAADAGLRRRLGRHRRRAHPRRQAARAAVARRRRQRLRRPRLLRRGHRRDRRGGDRQVAPADRLRSRRDRDRRRLRRRRLRQVAPRGAAHHPRRRPRRGARSSIRSTPARRSTASSRSWRAIRARFGERICFLHTGGIYGLFPKAEELEPLL